MLLHRLIYLFTYFCLFICCNQGIPNRPNIVYINVDDLGWKDTEPYGSTYYETPNVARLAASGKMFKRAYASAANCAPSRACLMTGLHTPRHEIFTVGSSERGSSRDRKLIPIENNTILADSFRTISEVLQFNGYRTGAFGKWHLGEDPLQRGFDVNFGGDQRGNPGKNGYFNPSEFPNMKDSNPGSYLTDELTSHVIKFMSESDTQPFFVYLSFYSVHTPLQAKKELIKKYELKTGNEFQNHATHAAMIESADINVGRILNFLSDNNLLKHTLIYFTSDNGGIASISSQHPLRGGKGSYYEGGIRVPLIISWEGQIQPGTVDHTPTTNLDFFPTILDITGITFSDYPLDGISIQPLFTNREIESRTLYWHFPIYLQAYAGPEDDARDTLFRTRPGSVLISDDYKLHHYFEDDALELYHLKDDIGERYDLSHGEPELTSRLFKRLDHWRKTVGAPIPHLSNPEYEE